ncbi:ABC transporter substrate-binding protein [Natrarchaeobius oligotrophus]|uniref:ABC transporter substrate-binding protein n=1 Tax=Natrarchaeobius chitinivorans TaxID=1679083 RepID=A0A3N6M714_NATCH|nr:ABC transporter substrate-binding protein [Natrarchaeobius chitinivorans]RQG99403.1 ABC transporter substrate-binding protein [Natrarchaeobius chitinivorans]
MGNESHTQENGAGTASNSRRHVLKAIGASGAVALAGCAGEGNGNGNGTGNGNGNGADDHAPIGNYPIEGDTAMYGWHGPLSGILAPDGEEQERGFELAIDHLNNGGGLVDHYDPLSGDGVLDYEIDYVTGDSAGDEETSIDNVERMIDRDNIQFWTGGVSSGVCQALQPIAQRERVIQLTSISHAGPITGENCERYSFRPSMSARTSAEALAATLPDLLGDDVDFFQIYLDYSYGISNRDSMTELMEGQGWNEIGQSAIAFGESDHSSQIADLDEADPDVLVFTTFGTAMADGISQMQEAGVAEDIDIVVPLLSAFSMEPAGGDAEGVIGTANWHPLRGDELSETFVDAYMDEYDELPGQAAYEVYDNVLHYSAAVENAGTFHPPTVVRELEEFEWNLAMGEMAYRECDHQASRPVYVCRGVSESEQQETGTYLELVEEVSPEDSSYDCDIEPAASCEMSEYE